MDSISVAPAPAVNLPEAPAARPSPDEANACAKPFEQTLKKEMAQSKPASDKAETAKAAKAAPAAAATATENTPVDPAEFAALLESAGLLETEDGLELAEVTDLAAEAVVTPDALVTTALPTDTTALPVHLLSETLARAGLSELEGDAEASAEPVIDGAPKLALPDVRGPRIRDEQPLEVAVAKTETPVSETLTSLFKSDRASNSDMPVMNTASTIDALSSPAFAQRWTTGPASIADAAAAAPTTTARIDTPFGDSAWGDAFQQKIVWLVDRQQQRAELHVNPAHLGPVEIMLNLGDESAAIAFSSPHQAVREAIEASLSDLRNALGERGLSLGEALVSADSGTAREQMAEEARNSGRGGRGGRGEGGGDAVPTEILPRRVSRGLVDLFA